MHKKKKRTLVSVIRDGFIPFKVGYSILILSYPTLFLLSFSFPPFVQSPDHSSSSSLFHIATRTFVNDDTNPTTAVESLHCDFSRDISAPMFARSLFSFMGKLSTSFLGFLRKRSNGVLLAFNPYERQVADTLAFWLVASFHHNRLRVFCVPSRVSCTQLHEMNNKAQFLSH